MKIRPSVALHLKMKEGGDKKKRGAKGIRIRALGAPIGMG